MRKAVISLLCALALLPCKSGQAQDKQMRIASLEWLPYVGSSLPAQGLSTFIVAQAAARFGHSVKIDYFPWKRAMQLGGRDPLYAGYFPAYYTAERAAECHFSQPIGSSNVGFAYLRETPFDWDSLEDLIVPAKLGIGVVYGYSNGEKFDVLMKQGRIKVESSSSDGQNIRKLALGRVRAAVVDEAVLRYLLKTDPMLASQARNIVFHPKLLAELKIYICFQQTAPGLEMKQAFDRALQDLNVRKLEEEYFQKLDQHKAQP
ncbi:transporter substrate-binding domain-containing protein [Massilia sp. W12]|uniref:substrate-binding periplasmic protein n=1 Tax=Massilia sp. W12 TaxID=3126507 RepID=UPI0030CFFB94